MTYILVASAYRFSIGPFDTREDATNEQKKMPLGLFEVYVLTPFVP
jgi:hypothetical protein